PCAGAETDEAAAGSITVTSTSVSSVPSRRTLTSTFRRVSPSSMSAASTASSRVRPRPSTDLIDLTSRLFVGALAIGRPLLLPLRLAVAVRRSLRQVARTGRGTAARRGSSGHGRRRRPLGPAPRQQISPPDHEALLNDTHDVPDEPVEAQAGGDLEGEDADHQR